MILIPKSKKLHHDKTSPKKWEIVFYARLGNLTEKKALVTLFLSKIVKIFLKATYLLDIHRILY